MKLLEKIVKTICIGGIIAVLGSVVLPANVLFAGQNNGIAFNYAQTKTADTIQPNSAEKHSTDTTKTQANSFETNSIEDLNKSYPFDLSNPENVQQTIEYDDSTKTYIFRTKVGDMDVAAPYVMSADEYREYTFKRDMERYWKEKNRQAADNFEDKFDLTDMKFMLGAADKVFGPGGVQIKTQGSAEITFGVKYNNIQNFLLAEHLRKKTIFDFDEKIQMNVKASVGDKISFGLNYDTESTFDFDRQNLKLACEGKEDEWIRKIEAGNVSMNLNSTLIPGATTLFGLKTDLQFGKMSVSAVLSQQQSSSQNVNTNGGVKTVNFDIPADMYDANRHYFLSQFFRQNYDKNMAQLPYIASGVIINKIEVWVTNKQANYQQARNIIAFTDLGENGVRNNTYWGGIPDSQMPTDNRNNALYNNIKGIAGIRNIDRFTELMSNNFSAYGIMGGEDYEKIESARLLNASDYTLNSELGFISLNISLNSDEVLAVAFEYTRGGTTYMVGEFSTGGINAPEALVVKLLKSTSVSTENTLWKLMMKNIYSLGASQFQRENFKLNVQYKNDSTGVYLNYIPAGNISQKLLLKVMNLDRLDNYNNPRPDGKFDFVEGYTIISSMGRVIFPVTEPFGHHLAQAIGTNDSLKYCFQELYDSTMVSAEQYAHKNKFRISGSYQGTSSSEISLNAMNVPRGSVKVTAGGVELTENVDYTVDYISGTVTILNQSILASNTPVDVRLENRELYSMQRKTLVGTHLEYAFNKDFSIGGTIMHLSETPAIVKTTMGSEPISNTIWGLNMAYKKEMQWLTTAIDKLPLLELSAPSSIQFQGEFAQMIPGHKKINGNPGYAYIDDFEATESVIDLRYPHYWFLSSTPSSKFAADAASATTDYGKNRALLAWYSIDNSIFNTETSNNPFRGDKDALSNHLTRAIGEKEVFPNREPMTALGGGTAYLPVMNLSYYPTERGPYNLDTDYAPNGKLNNPRGRWGGIMRKIDMSDFDRANIEYLEFWLMDPFVNDSTNTATGGDLYINLGEISEDILKDGIKFFENGMPANGDTTFTQRTIWGRVPKQQSTVVAFSTEPNARKYQDVGYNGLRTEEEFEFDTYRNYLQTLRSVLPAATIAEMEANPFSPFNDPAGDNYHYYRGSDYDAQRRSILERYKYFNGTEGNSAEANSSGETYATASTSLPDVEDINSDNTLSEYEKYFEYVISLRKGDMQIGTNNITDIMESEPHPKLKNGNTDKVKWYQFRIPLRNITNSNKKGGIRDFKSIRFMRLFLTNFEQETHLRFATMNLVRGDWRVFSQNLYQSVVPPSVNGSITSGSVNIEENGSKQPVNYVLPPGVDRQIDPGQPQARQQNEQSLQLKVIGLAKDDARAVYKTLTFDLRQYRRMQMFAHAEKMLDDVNSLEDYELAAFIRVGSDFTENYYEYELPLKLTPYGHYTKGSEVVWQPENKFDFPLSLFTEIKKKRNTAKNQNPNITLLTPYGEYIDTEHPNNKVTIMGSPNLGEVKTIMIGIRNKASNGRDNNIRSGEIWVNELLLTDYDEDGGIGALGNVVLNLSDFANVNLSGHYEQSGFGGIEKRISERRLDDYYQFNIATSVQIGKFFPDKAKVNLPAYYSYSVENTKPKYNPFDGDLLLKDALGSYDKKEQKDSLLKITQTRTITESFNITGAKVDIRGKRPRLYDPANISVSYTYQKQQMLDAETERNANITYQGTLSYDFNTQPQTWEPFKDSKKMKGKSWGLINGFGLNYSPSRLSASVNVNRMYSETQLRDIEGTLAIDKYNPYNPLLSSSKNFTWGRNFAVNWDFTKTLKISFQTAANSRIDETMYAPVNKKFFPNEYEDWKDTVLQSLKHLGTPLTYQQNLNVQYDVPFNRIPALDWISTTATYNVSYNWNLGAVLSDSVNLGNNISNTATWGIKGDLKFENLYNKSKYLKTINDKYSSRNSSRNRFIPKTIERKVYVSHDSTEFKHGLNADYVSVTAKTLTGKKAKVGFSKKDKNTIKITSTANDTLMLSITTVDPNTMKKFTSKDILDFSVRTLMLVRSVQVDYSHQTGMSIAGFDSQPKIFGQMNESGILVPGLDFAFGIPNEDYLEKAYNRAWLIHDSTITTPANSNFLENLDIRVLTEPFAGFKVDFNARRQYTTQKTIQLFDNLTSFGGNFSMTYVSIGTSFWAKNTRVGNERSFALFQQYRQTMANQLQRRYEGTYYPTGGFVAGTPFQGQPYNEANGKITPSSTDAMLPAFLAAYSGHSINKVGTDIIPALLSLLPNWSVSYNGLTRIPLIAKVANSVTINHKYTSVYTINSYSSFATYIENDYDLGFVKDAITDSPVPSSGYDVSAASLAEHFSPFLGVDMVFKNSFTGGFKYNRSRTVSLNLPSMQIGEIYSNEIEMSIGYIIKDFDMLIKLKTNKVKKVKNNLTTRLAFSIKDQSTLLRKIDEPDEPPQATMGNKLITIKASADYVFSSKLNFRFFFDYTSNAPIITTSYPMSNINAGLSIKFLMTR